MIDFKFYLVTDTHYLASSIPAYGEAYKEYMRFEQKCCAETRAINRALFEQLKNSHEAETVIFAGDLTFNGERASHEEFSAMLADLKASGKAVYVVTADHDCKSDPFAFDETGRIGAEGIDRAELLDFYAPFGFGDAIARDDQHLSYVAQLAPGLRLLALNNDGADDGRRRFDDAQIAWIKEQTAKAREDGQMMIAVNHYPLLAGQPIFSLIGSAVQKEAGKAVEMLADEGVHLCFTGHMHNQSINEIVTFRGNRFYDVCTGAAIADPAYYRLVTIPDEYSAKIESIECPVSDFDGVTIDRKYLKDQFDGMILNLIADMKTDPERLLRKFGIGDKKALIGPFRWLGKKLDTKNMGQVARLLAVKCPEELRSVPFKIFICDLVRGIFEGNQTYTEGTARGDLFLTVLRRVRFILNRVKPKNNDGQQVDLFDILRESAGNYGYDDYNAELKLKDRRPDEVSE